MSRGPQWPKYVWAWAEKVASQDGLNYEAISRRFSSLVSQSTEPGRIEQEEDRKLVQYLLSDFDEMPQAPSARTFRRNVLHYVRDNHQSDTNALASAREGDIVSNITKAIGLLVLLLIALVIMPDSRVNASDCDIVNNNVESLIRGPIWLSYDPREFDPARNPNPSLASINKDLQEIRSAGFGGIITFNSVGYSAAIPRSANQYGLEV